MQNENNHPDPSGQFNSSDIAKSFLSKARQDFKSPMMVFLAKIAYEAVLDLALQIDAIDGMIVDIDLLLNDLQPPQSGKIRIVFSPIDGVGRPVPVIYRRSRVDNKWKYDQIGRARLPMRAKRARDFSDTHEQVTFLLSWCAELMEQRADLIKSITSSKMSAAQRLRAIIPKGTQFRQLINQMAEDRDNGKYRTFGTGHNPPREV